MSRKLRALIIEDSADDALLMIDLLNQNGFEVSYRMAATPDDVQQALAASKWDVILSDYRLPGFTGLDALKICNERQRDTPFLLVSGSIGEDLAVEAMRAGARDYLLKDRMTRLPAAVSRELEEAENRRDKRAAERERIRQRRELELRAEQLYRSNKDLERFAYLAAHDLQEPLRTVASYSQLLVRKYGNYDSDTQEIVSFITWSVRRMEELLRGVLTYSKAANDPETRFSIIDTGAVLNRVLTRLDEKLKNAAVEVQFGALPVINADAEQLEEIFYHLLSNALKYRKKDAPAKIQIETAERDSEYLFTVRDNGIGIAREHFDRIFIVFKRLHRDSEYPGIGLGLALAKRSVENHRGRIWVESELGQGSSFHFTIAKSEPESLSE